MPSPPPGWLLAAWVALSALGGCDSRPRALPLDDSPVYSNPREGFRFFPPEEWKQTARGVVPSGRIITERLLVEYKLMTGTKPAVLQVSVADVPESVALADHIKAETYRAEDWKATGPAESFQINGVPAARISYRMPAGKDPLVREIIAFRRGERVYFFTGIYAASDAKSRKAFRSAVDSVVW
jgi:hypothetical protein